MYSRKQMEFHKYGPYQVTVIENFILQLKDGTKIASKIWFPGPLQNPFHTVDSKWIKLYCKVDLKHVASEVNTIFPTVIEFAPYDKHIFTTLRDHLRYPWLAAHGYVVIRADRRGSGDSTGYYFDEYIQQV